MADVVVEDISKVGWTRDGFGVSGFLGESCHFATRFDGVGASVGECDCMLSEGGEIGDDGLDIPEASAPLEKLRVELHFCWKGGADSVSRRWSN